MPTEVYAIKVEIVGNEKVETAFRQMTDEGKKLQKVVSGLSTRYKKMSDRMTELSGVTETGTRQMTKVAGSARTAAQSMGVYETRTKSAWQSSTSLVSTLRTMLGVYATFGAVRAATNTLFEFDQAITNVGVVSGASADEMRRLTETARQLGGTTQFTASQAADGLLFLSRAGFTANEAMAAIPATLDLATVGMIDLGQSSDIASNILRQFGLQAESTSRITDALINVSNNSNTSITQLGDAMKFAGPLAKGLGLSIEETAAAMGALGDAGIQASLAGTNVRGILARLIEPTAKGRKEFEKYGLALSDVDVRSVGLVRAFENMRQAGIDANSLLNIFGRLNVSAAVAIQDNVDGMRELVDIQRENIGVTGEAASAMRDTLLGSFKELVSATQELILSMGDNGISGLLKSSIESVTGFVRGLSEMEDQMALVSSILKGLGVLLAGYIARSTAAALASSKMAISATAATGAMAKLSAVLRATPFGLIVTGIAVATTAFSMFDRHIESSKSRVEAFKDELKKFREEQRNQVEQLNDSLSSNRGARVAAESLGDVEGAISANLSIANDLETQYSRLTSALGSIEDLTNAATAVERMNNTWRNFQQALNEGRGSQSLIDQLFEDIPGLEEQFARMSDRSITGLSNAYAELSTQIFAATQTSTEQLQKQEAVAQSVVDGIAGNMQTLRTIAEQTVGAGNEGVLTNLLGTPEGVQEFTVILRQAIDSLREVPPAAVNGEEVLNRYKEAFAGVVGSAQQAVDGLSNFNERAKQAVMGSEVLASLRLGWSEAVDFVQQQVNSVQDLLALPNTDPRQTQLSQGLEAFGFDVSTPEQNAEQQLLAEQEKYDMLLNLQKNYTAQSLAEQTALSNAIVNQEKRVTQLKQAEFKMQISAASNAIGTLQNLVTAFGSRSLRESKGLAIAFAIMNTAVGITKALSDTEIPWFMRVSNAALVASTGAAQIATINRASKSGGAAPTLTGGGGGTAASAPVAPQATSLPQVSLNFNGTTTVTQEQIDQIQEELGERLSAGSQDSSIGFGP